MDHFLTLSLRKQKRHLKHLEDSNVLINLLREEYISSTDTLDLVVKRLLEFDVLAVSNVVDAPIRKAIEHGNLEHIQLLLHFHTYHPKSDLYHCVKHQQFEIFDLLLAHTHMDKQQMIDSVLADVCLSEGEETLKAVDLLMERGANPSAFNLKALAHAIYTENMVMIEKLIPLSDVKNFGNSALAAAAQNNLPDVVQQLLEAGAPYDKDNSKPLRMAVRHNHPNVVERLLQWDKAFDNVMEDALCSWSTEMPILELLWEHCNIEAVREQLPNYTNQGRERFDVLYAQHQKQVLNHIVNGQGTQGTTSRGRKI